jgi:hypothetical protein
MITIPCAGQVYRHYKGDLYTILSTGYSSRNGDATVYYHRTGDLDWRANTYDRSLSEFLGTVETSRGFSQRFIIAD